MDPTQAREHAYRKLLGSACMTRKTGGFGLAATLGVLGCACSNAPADMSLADFCTQARDLSLQRVSECLSGPVEGWATLSPDRCLAWVLAIQASRATTALDKADECLAALRDMPCAELLKSSTGVCDEVLVGIVPAGGSCYDIADTLDDGVDCRRGNFCTATSATCPGVCVARVLVGGACTDRECVDNADCLEQVCQARIARGQPCRPGSSAGTTGGVAPGSALCESQYDYCERSSSTCQPRKAEGACASRSECLPTHYCAKGSGGSTGECTLNAKIGEPCVVGQWQCESYSFCDPQSNLCRIDGGMGDMCGYTADTAPREVADCINSWCALVPGHLSGTCQSFRALGETCAADDECGAPVNSCDTARRVCVAACFEP
jgi:hypothetical protein